MNTTTAFRKAALADDIETMAGMIDAEPSLAGKENPEGLSLDRLALTIQFHLAILDGKSGRVQELLGRHEDLVRQRWTRQGFTPLSQAVVECHREIFDLLIDHGADPLETYDAGSGLLHTAAYSGCVSIARQLVEKGLEADRKNDRGETPMKIARDFKQQPMIDFLLSQGAGG